MLCFGCFVNGLFVSTPSTLWKAESRKKGKEGNWDRTKSESKGEKGIGMGKRMRGKNLTLFRLTGLPKIYNIWYTFGQLYFNNLQKKIFAVKKNLIYIANNKLLRIKFPKNKKFAKNETCIKGMLKMFRSFKASVQKSIHTFLAKNSSKSASFCSRISK